jgi:hypothetical protein
VVKGEVVKVNLNKGNLINYGDGGGVLSIKMGAMGGRDAGEVNL